VGNALSKRLIADGWAVTGAIRRGGTFKSVEGVSLLEIGDIDNNTDWKMALKGIDAVVHAAARVHVLKDTVADPLEAYRSVNVNGTMNLAHQAAAAGVRRFIFLSSIKVNGEENSVEYRETDKPAPLDSYGISKMEAENKLRKTAPEMGMEVVILRPPLIYGPGVRANFLKLLKAVDRGLPLPLASINNRRSMIYVENLVDAIALCLRHPKAADQTFLLSDGENLSTPDLIHRIATALGKKKRLIPLTPIILDILARVVGKGQMASRLTGSLTLDDSKIRRELGWNPPFTIGHGIAKTVSWYKHDCKPTR